MKMYQLHLNGKNRAYHNFKTYIEANEHKTRLLKHIRGCIEEGRVGFRAYFEEAKNLKIEEVDIKQKNIMFSVVEYANGYSSVVRTYYERNGALSLLTKLQENSKRSYTIMESIVNGHERTNNTRQRRDYRAS